MASSDSRLNALNAQIAKLEAQVRVIKQGLNAPGNLAADDGWSVGGCSYGCTDGCTRGCTSSCATGIEDVISQPGNQG